MSRARSLMVGLVLAAITFIGWEVGAAVVARSVRPATTTATTTPP